MKSCSNSHECCHLWLGLVAFTIGAVFLLQMFDVIPEATWSYLWPIILVVSGLKMMMHSCCSSCETDCCDTGCCDSACMPCEKPAPKKKAPAKKAAPKKKTTKKKK